MRRTTANQTHLASRSQRPCKRVSASSCRSWPNELWVAAWCRFIAVLLVLLLKHQRGSQTYRSMKRRSRDVSVFHESIISYICLPIVTTTGTDGQTSKTFGGGFICLHASVVVFGVPVANGQCDCYGTPLFNSLDNCKTHLLARQLYFCLICLGYQIVNKR